MENINLKNIDKLIKEGYISERWHSSAPYRILNYTQKTQYEQLWNEDTMNCRGLILDGEGNIIAKPFKKFFNIGEYSEQNDLGKIPNYTYFDIWEKIDGSLGILYKMPNSELRIATRGSFESEQAIEGTEMLSDYIPEIFDVNNYTFLFEIIYPENRIVVNYGNREDLVLLAGINKKTGEELSYETLLMLSEKTDFPITQYYGRVSYNRHAFLKIDNDIPEGDEGFVLKFDNGLRVKIKSEEYVRLHRIVTGLNSKSIWDLLRREENLEELLDRVPDEFYEWAKEIKTGFETNYNSIEHSCDVIVKSCKLKDRKEIAEYFLKKEHKIYSSILFTMLDDKPYKEAIWKILKPKYAKPFQEARE